MVMLSPHEMYLASMVGVRRRLASLHAGMSERNGASRHSIAEQWFFNVVGAQGELAAAKALQVYWPASINAKKADADLLPNIQVRTLERHDYDLIVRADDPDGFAYVLVTGSGPQFQVHGWVYGNEAKRAEWLFDRGNRDKPCYWVPQKSLRDLATLPLREAA